MFPFKSRLKTGVILNKSLYKTNILLVDTQNTKFLVILNSNLKFVIAETSANDPIR